MSFWLRQTGAIPAWTVHWQVRRCWQNQTGTTLSLLHCTAFCFLFMLCALSFSLLPFPMILGQTEMTDVRRPSLILTKDYDLEKGSVCVTSIRSSLYCPNQSKKQKQNLNKLLNYRSRNAVCIYYIFWVYIEIILLKNSVMMLYLSARHLISTKGHKFSDWKLWLTDVDFLQLQILNGTNFTYWKNDLLLLLLYYCCTLQITQMQQVQFYFCRILGNTWITNCSRIRHGMVITTFQHRIMQMDNTM